jgi:hypothetical protein
MRMLSFSIESNLPREITAVSIEGDNADDFHVDLGSCTIGMEIVQTTTCTLSVTFNPTAEGVRAAMLVIDTKSGGRTKASLEGSGNSASPPQPSCEINASC